MLVDGFGGYLGEVIYCLRIVGGSDWLGVGVFGIEDFEGYIVILGSIIGDL